MAASQNDDISTSEFIVAVDDAPLTGEFSDLTPIDSEGFNQLVKAQRYGRWFLLKGLKPQYRGQHAYETLLRKEFEIMMRLHHPGVVDVIDWTQVDGVGNCIVMEWVDGQSLKQWLADGHSHRERRRLAGLIVDALAYVHSQQTAHRDLKPSNIMVTRNGQFVKLIDFGLSDTDDYAILKQPAGTKHYVSPEQQTSRLTDVRNDIYSLGCVLDNLRLGPLYRGVVKRCRAPLHKRYAAVTQVGDALRRCARLPWLALAAVLLALAVWGVWMLHGERKTLEKSNAQVTLQTDSLHRQVQDVRQGGETMTEEFRRKNDSLQSRINELELEKQQAQQRSQMIAQLTDDGKRQLDQLVKSSGIEQHLDTLSSPAYFKTSYNEVINSVVDFPHRYSDGLSANITDAERSGINYALSSYMSSRYVSRWSRRLGVVQ